MRRNLIPVIRATILAAVLCLVAAVPCAAQTTWTVATTADDGGANTLRAVLALAQGGDTINITATGTIALNLASGPLIVDKSVAIAGPGRDVLTIDGGYAAPGTGSRVFLVGTTGAGVDVTVSAAISGLAIANGACPASEVGGGLRVGPMATVTLSDSALTGNRGDWGGAIANAGTLTLTNCALTGNSGLWGGAIANAGTLTLTNCALTGNSATNGGGAIFCLDGALTVTGCTLSDNAVLDRAWVRGGAGGGAISCMGWGTSASLDIRSSTLSGNAAWVGGAIALWCYDEIPDEFEVGPPPVPSNLQASVIGCTFTNNKAWIDPTRDTSPASGAYGGAVALLAVDPYPGMGAAALSVDRSTFRDNAASGDYAAGGALLLWGSINPAIVSVVGSTLSGNTASGTTDAAGGAIHTLAFSADPASAPPTRIGLRNCTVSGNSAVRTGDPGQVPGPGGTGGAIWVEGPSVSVDNCTLVGNSDQFGASGIYTFRDGAGMAYGSDVAIRNSILANASSGKNLVNRGGSIASGGYNLCTDDGKGILGDLLLTALTDKLSIDPMLGPLADNRGPTWTCALLPGSPAIDAGASTDIAGGAVTADQRGIARPQGSANDIGAFEREPNPAPIANAGPDQTVQGVHTPHPGEPWAPVTLDGSGSIVPAGSEVTYSWTDEECGVTVTGPKPTLTLAGAYHLITLTVTDSSGAGSSDQVVVEITPPPNAPPVADAGADRSVTATHSGHPEMDTAKFYVGSSSTDPDGDELRYEWSENGVPITSAQFFPVTRGVGTYTFSLTVWDTYNASSSATVTVTVLPAQNRAPVAEAGPNQNVTVEHDGDPTTADATIRLNGSGSTDPDSVDRLTYVWTEGGVVCGGGPSPSVSRPAGTYTFTLKVTDPYGASSSDNVTVRVEPEPNYPPVADAGPDQTLVATGTTTPVTLDGSASYDWDWEDGLTYSWTEGGTLIGTGIAPSVKLAGGVHTIALTVTDPYGESSTDTVQVSIVSALDVSDATLTKNGKTFTITVNITNRTATTASNVTVNAARLDGSETNSLLPLLFGSIKPGVSKQCRLQFKAVQPDANGRATLTISGTCSLGAFFTTQTVSVP